MRDESDGRSPAPTRHLHSKKLKPRSEFDFIERVRQLASKQPASQSKISSLIPHPSSLIQGIGDDAAVLRNRAGFETVVTSDLLVEDIDFRLDTTTPRLLGHKALAVSLSDVAAMGARPRWTLLSIGSPRHIWKSRFLDDFYEGFFELASAHGVRLIGGDVSRTGGRGGSTKPAPLVIDSIVIGEVGKGRAVFRSGARPGDKVFVTGSLGGAAAGLRLLEGGKRLRDAPSLRSSSKRFVFDEAQRRLMLRQLRPEPRTSWGQLLGEKRLATSMIDISDGLSSDLAHLCHESGVGASIYAHAIPVDPHINRLSEFRQSDTMQIALSGGEDFELLFTASTRNVRKIPKDVDGIAVTEIGEIIEPRGVVLLNEHGRTRRLDPSGFRHF